MCFVELSVTGKQRLGSWKRLRNPASMARVFLRQGQSIRACLPEVTVASEERSSTPRLSLARWVFMACMRKYCKAEFTRNTHATPISPHRRRSDRMTFPQRNTIPQASTEPHQRHARIRYCLSESDLWPRRLKQGFARGALVDQVSCHKVCVTYSQNRRFGKQVPFREAPRVHVRRCSKPAPIGIASSCNIVPS